MAHASRKFDDCRTYEPEKAEHVLKQFGRVYTVERSKRAANPIWIG